MREILVLGIGNVLWADEGFGVRAVEALDAGSALPGNVRLMDGGTQGVYLLPHIQAAGALIILDAIDYGLEPGTIRVIEDAAVPTFMGAKKMSLHQTGFQEVLASAFLLGWKPERIVLIGVQPEEIEDYGGSLRPVVAAAIGPAVALALAELARLGVDATPREGATDETNPLARDAYEGGRPAAEEACRTGDARFLPMRRHA